MAIAEEHLAAKFNRPGYDIVDHYTYVLAGDGCMMEGISSEAASLAGTLKLSKLIVLYDSNQISIEGSTDIAFTEDVAKRFEAYGWQVLVVEDGNDVDEIGKAIAKAKAEEGRPTLIEVKTEIGYGCPSKQGSASAHGEPLGEDNLRETKEFLGWKWDEPFYVPSEVRQHMEDIIAKGKEMEDEWNELWEAYKEEYPELAKEWEIWHDDNLPVDLSDDEDFWTFDGAMATRASSGEVINRLSKVIPNLIGGSADLSPSTKTIMNDRGHFSADDRLGSNMHFGVREHAMAAIGNGMA